MTTCRSISGWTTLPGPYAESPAETSSRWRGGDGLLRARETIRPYQNCTLRLTILKDDGSAVARQSVLKVFHRLGTTGEGIERYRMVALDVPPDADSPRIRKLLEHGAGQGWWHWEEVRVTAAWRSTAAD
ncbi:DUF4265 domain-containing protein [Streptomyces wuyuanensis]|uniref:DUF4265 domain-containing protein n=1 Tax=Streptomyces wuyuanensis TaxID=1196353 RepID=UPI003788664C